MPSPAITPTPDVVSKPLAKYSIVPKLCCIAVTWGSLKMANGGGVRWGGVGWGGVGWGGTSLAVQWLRLYTSSAEGAGSIPGRGTKIPHAAWHGQKNKNKNG